MMHVSGSQSSGKPPLAPVGMQMHYGRGAGLKRALDRIELGAAVAAAFAYIEGREHVK